MSLAMFGCLLTLVESTAADRVYAAYGAVYIAGSIVWMWLAEGVRTDPWDLTGVAVFLFGAAIILAAPRAAV